MVTDNIQTNHFTPCVYIWDNNGSWGLELLMIRTHIQEISLPLLEHDWSTKSEWMMKIWEHTLPLITAHQMHPWHWSKHLTPTKKPHPLIGASLSKPPNGETLCKLVYACMYVYVCYIVHPSSLHYYDILSWWPLPGPTMHAERI